MPQRLALGDRCSITRMPAATMRPQLTKQLDERLAKEAKSRASELPGHRSPATARRARRSPMPTSFSPTPATRRCWSRTSPTNRKPDDWLIHAYFEHAPDGRRAARRCAALGYGRAADRGAGRGGLGDDEPGRAPADPRRPLLRPHADVSKRSAPDAIPFEIDASLAFGTGQHATTSGCLEALDKLERDGAAVRQHRRHRHRHRTARLRGAGAVAGGEMHRDRHRPGRGRASRATMRRSTA